MPCSKGGHLHCPGGRCRGKKSSSACQGERTDPQLLPIQATCRTGKKSKKEVFNSVSNLSPRQAGGLCPAAPRPHEDARESPPGRGPMKSLVRPHGHELRLRKPGAHTSVSRALDGALPTQKMNRWRRWTGKPPGVSSFSLSPPFFHQGAPCGS